MHRWRFPWRSSRASARRRLVRILRSKSWLAMEVLEVSACFIAYLAAGLVGILAIGAVVGIRAVVENVRFRRASYASAVVQVEDPTARDSVTNTTIRAALKNLGLDGKVVLVTDTGWGSPSPRVRAGSPPQIIAGSIGDLYVVGDEVATVEAVSVVLAHEWGHIELGHERRRLIYLFADWGSHRILSAAVALWLVGLVGPIGLFALVAAPRVLNYALAPLWAMALRSDERAADRVAIRECGADAVVRCLRGQAAFAAFQIRAEAALDASWGVLSEAGRDQLVGEVVYSRRTLAQREADLQSIEAELDRADPGWRAESKCSFVDRLRSSYRRLVSDHDSIERRIEIAR